MIHLHLLYIFIQSSFKFTIKFVGPTINLKVKLKITFLEAISLSQFSNVLFIHHFDLHQGTLGVKLMHMRSTCIDV